MDGDWTQTVCNGCYSLQVNAQREEVTKTAKAKRHPVEAKQQLSGKVKPKDMEGSPPQRIGKKEQQLQHRMPGVDRLLVFFRTAGVSVGIGRRGSLVINGSRTPPLAWILPSPKRIDWNDVIDEMALRYVGGKFLRAVTDNACFDAGLRAFLRRREKGFAIMRGDVRLAIIHATSAQIPHRDVIYGNFLKPGPHWQQVADVVHGAEAELVAEWKRGREARAASAAAEAAAEAERRRAAARRRIDHLPNDLAPELIDACLDASRRIRLERQVAYERPVILECGFGELTLLPIAGAETRLLVPFRLSKGTDTLKGELVLGDCDPLPLLIADGVADEDAITAWTCALLGFADATCIEFEPVEPTTRRDAARPRLRPSASIPQRHPLTQALPRKRPWPTHLEPVGHWIRYSGSFVAGHRRRLLGGQTASDQARDRARQVGIILHPNETWVRSHTRGVPNGIEMRFIWHAPTELKLSHT
jgi:hypothetical protein